MSIRIKLILAIGLTMAIFGSLAIFVVYNQNRHKLTEHLFFDIKDNVNYTSQLVKFYLDGAKSNLINLSEDPILLDALENNDLNILAEVTAKLNALNQISEVVGNVALQVVSSTKCVTIAADKTAQSTIGVDWSDRDYCKVASATKMPYLSPAFINAASKKPTLAFAVPIKNYQGEMLGLLVGFIDLSQLRGYLWDLQHDSVVYLLDHNKKLFLTTSATSRPLDLSVNNESKFNKIIVKLNENIFEGYQDEGSNFIGYKFDGDIVVIYEKPTIDLLALVYSLNTVVVFSIVIAIILVFLILVLFLSKITNRISRLSNVTKEITNGNFDVKLNENDLKLNDEIGLLGKSFVEMASKLSGIYKNLDNEVKSRTKEIQEKNLKLSESENEIKKALNLAEQTNKLMVGRELKMLELKEELRKLKK